MRLFLSLLSWVTATGCCNVVAAERTGYEAGLDAAQRIQANARPTDTRAAAIVEGVTITSIIIDVLFAWKREQDEICSESFDRGFARGLAAGTVRPIELPRPGG